MSELQSKPKIGFQFKGSTKRKLITEVKDEQNKEAIVCIEGSTIVSEAPKNVPNQLVIPLPPAKKSKESEKGSVNASRNMNADDLAAAEIILESKGMNSNSISDQISIASIPVLAAPGNATATWTPIILANQAPELVGLKDESERFKVDLSLRPNEMDVRSDSYQHIPIEEFGAAMLRGMGWTGPTEEDKLKKFDIQPRDYRLGLGALPKPPDLKGPGNPIKKKEEIQKWAKKANEALKKQVLKVFIYTLISFFKIILHKFIYIYFVWQCDDIVWLRDPLFAGRRAKITATAGVPGLDRIR